MTPFQMPHRLKSNASAANRIMPDAKDAAHYWPLLDALTKARTRYDLLPATLMVLKALCSFLPRGSLTEDAQMLVWPSNATLIERCAGLPERSLRRHLDRLIAAGFINRKSSANGKRFALRIRNTLVDAYGFDLAPLFNRQEEVLLAAEEEQIIEDTARCLRSQIRSALNDVLLADVAPDEDSQHQILNALRRRPDFDLYQKILADLQQRLDGVIAPVTEHMTDTDSQNGRHLQNTNKESIHFVFSKTKNLSQETNDCGKAQRQPLNLPTLVQCKESLKASCDFAPHMIENWDDLHRHAQMLSPMIGIEAKQMMQAMQIMGPLPASVSVLCLVQLAEKLHRPAAYLQRLIQRAMNGTFSLSGLLRAAEKMNPSAAA